MQKAREEVDRVPVELQRLQVVERRGARRAGQRRANTRIQQTRTSRAALYSCCPLLQRSAAIANGAAGAGGLYCCVVSRRAYSTYSTVTVVSQFVVLN